MWLFAEASNYFMGKYYFIIPPNTRIPNKCIFGIIVVFQDILEAKEGLVSIPRQIGMIGTYFILIASTLSEFFKLKT